MCGDRTQAAAAAAFRAPHGGSTRKVDVKSATRGVLTIRIPATVRGRTGGCACDSVGRLRVRVPSCPARAAVRPVAGSLPRALLRVCVVWSDIFRARARVCRALA